MSRTLKGPRTLPCDGTVADKLRVKWNSGTSMLTACGTTDNAIGIVDGVPLNGRAAIINPITEDGVSILSSATIAVGGTCYAGANGTVAAAGTIVVGVNWAPGVINGAWADVQMAKATG